MVDGINRKRQEMQTRLCTATLARDWQPCPIYTGDLDLDAGRLRQLWAQAHRGDREPYPENPSTLDAWRCYHLGDFARAVAIGREAGADGLLPAAFACATYACYLEQDESRKRNLFRNVMEWCEQAQAEGISSPNLRYIYAYAMDGFSQHMSMIETVTQGFGLRIREQVEGLLAIDNQHVEAHILLARWHAQMCTRASRLTSAVLYGASQEAAVAHYELATELLPDCPVPYTDYAAGLEMMFADRKRLQVIALITCSLGKPGFDAKQRLAQEVARKRLRALHALPGRSRRHSTNEESRRD